jgi:CubicO group peptidase (beta-lactamase class C family)
VRGVESVAEVVERAAARSGFSGVVRVDRGDDVVFAKAYGLADRRHGIAMAVDSQLAVASGAKGFTALVVMSLVEQGGLALDTPARAVLRDDLPLIAGDVTIEHLLAHRSGIGDYLDESEGGDIGAYAMPVPVHTLATTADYLPLLDGHPTKFAAGERFAYCNGGFVVLALIAERVAGRPFHDLVRERVCDPAGLADTAFLRSDDLPGRAAVHYVEVDGVQRTNVMHLPVVGSGDGGIFTTAADVHRFWTALFDGRIVATTTVEQMVRPRSDVPSEQSRYGLGFWLAETGPGVALEGYDAGVSFRSDHDPATGTTTSVLANTSEGAWPIIQALDAA